MPSSSFCGHIVAIHVTFHVVVWHVNHVPICQDQNLLLDVDSNLSCVDYREEVVNHILQQSDEISYPSVEQG